VVIVDSGATVDGLTVLSGGEVANLGGTVSGLVVSQGGKRFNEVVSSGQTVRDADILDGLYLDVKSGGSAIDPTVQAGGEIIFGGGTITGLKVSSGGKVDVASGVTVRGLSTGALVELDVQSGASVSGLKVASGGSVFLLSGGRATGLVMAASTSLIVDGGSVTSLTMGENGFLDLNENGLQTSAVLTDVNSEDFGTAISTTVIGGIQDVDLGGVARQTVISGGDQLVGNGTASGTIVRDGGFQDVDGRAFGTVVSSGTIILEYGGVASGITVSSGGYVDFKGGEASGLVLEAGGRIALSNIPADAGVIATFQEAASNKSGVLTIDGSGQEQTITLFGQYIAAGFQIVGPITANNTIISYDPHADAQIPLAGGARS
jgi:autotransporter passenger strand-loop-strand repeat protein